MKIRPVEGWALNYVVELDLHSPGTAGAFLRASNEASVHRSLAA